MNEKFLIGELASIFTISTDTLRYYEKIGLFYPDEISENGYRYYSLRSFFALSRILFFKELDIPLEDIKKYLKDKNLDNLKNMLERRKIDIDIKINSLMNIRKTLLDKIALLDSKFEYGKVRVVEIDEFNLLFLYSSYRVNDAKKNIRKNSLLINSSTWITQGQVYTLVDKEDLLKGEFSKFSYYFNLQYIDEDLIESIKHINGGKYIALTFKGSYNEFSEQYIFLLDYIEKNGYIVNGDSIEMNIVDYDYSSNEDEYISEIMIPIKEAINE
jgi:DNA-binding transcriptional MerR regulator